MNDYAIKVFGHIPTLWALDCMKDGHSKETDKELANELSSLLMLRSHAEKLLWIDGFEAGLALARKELQSK